MTVWSHIAQLPSQLGLRVWIQVRTATKRAAGSRTSMKDSAGRRLGPKKHEGQAVKPGEIIMRQRGTKFYPGENVGIGKDHTIFALEPGFVRYYLDPFHPKRKFIGVALGATLRLPTPHFEPRVRRFGRGVIEDAEAREAEERSLPRKVYLSMPTLLEEQSKREEKRAELAREFEGVLRGELGLELEGAAMELAKNYLVRVRNSVRNGFSLEDARFNSMYFFRKELELAGAPRETGELLASTVELLNKETSFDNRHRLTRYISEEERTEWVQRLLKELQGMEVRTAADKRLIEEKLADASKYMTLSEELRTRRRFLKPVLPEQTAVTNTLGKDTTLIKRFNSAKRRLEVVVRTKEAYLSKL